MKLVNKAEILVVDDSEISLLLLNDLLTSAGYRVRLVPEPKLALESALADPPDLILLDVMMPGMDGFELCQRLKQDERTAQLSIIFISALHEMHDRVRGFEVGGVDFISKPIQAQEVLARVSVHLELFQTRQELVARTLTLEAEIRERTEVEEALEVSEARFRSIFRDVPDAIGIANIERQIVLINPAFSDTFGYSLEEIQGETTAVLYESQEEFKSQGRLRFNLGAIEKGSKPYVVNYRRKNGEIFPGETVSTVVNDEDGNMVSCLVVIRDISERKAAEKELQEINAALRVLLKTRQADEKYFEEKTLYNVKRMVLPHLERLKQYNFSQDQLLHLTSLETNLNDIVSSFSHTLSLNFLDLTPTEIQVTNLVRQGRTSKEIASLLHVTLKTIEAHRYNIRKKLNLNRKKGNLRSLLISFHPDIN